MTKSTQVNFVLCWHMHQPWYQQGIEGEYKLPWVYLHALKDYTDMAAQLEAHPDMKSVVNFAPVLLEQLDDYAQQLNGWLESAQPMKDPLLNLLAGVTPVPESIEQRYQLLCKCQRANAEKMIDPYADFKRLLEPFNKMFAEDDSAQQNTVCLQYLTPQYFIDVLVWYHLAWLGHSLKQSRVCTELIKKSAMFNEQNRRDLLQLIHESIAGIIPRYRKMAHSGQIELSMTPYGHPIIPLLNNFQNMQCSQPEAAAPACEAYPGGIERSRWHIQQGLDCFEHYFGLRPQGIWLSEGAISEDAIALIEEFDFKWTASGEGVWRNSMHLCDHDPEKIYSERALFYSYQLRDHSPKIFFRDDGLSDLIGFEYSKHNSVDAADDLLQHLLNIADFLGEEADQHVVSIILDGENAWEYYPHNGHYFLDHLYTQLSHHPRIKSATFSELTELPKVHKLDQICAGSWVYGSFSTWIGEADKNTAWERLVEAKQVYDRVIDSAELSADELQQATRQLAICEGSDWFWWFGDNNPSASVRSFDELFRGQLTNLYSLLKQPPPDNLQTPISSGSGDDAENAGTMLRSF